MANVQIIQANKDRIDRSSGVVIEKLRVCAYCRVSTDSDEQMNSYDSQVKHYKKMIEQKKEWHLVDIYADAGISGTQTAKRDEFQRMIQDVKSGLLDLVITKSISRFARNTMDILKYVRLLRDHNVAIIFEKENINTLEMNSEMLLTLLSSLAQQESESLSQNIKMGLTMKMKRGELVGYQGCLGYDYDKITKSIHINEEEAKIVRYIFDRYTSGIGCFVIAKELTAMGAKTKRGNTVWGDTGVRGIITNEKYKGDVLMQKTFTVDPLTKRRLDNFGEEQKYYISDHHEPIISAEQFDEAQKILQKRSKNFNKGRMNKFSQQYTFSSMIECGFCGGGVTRRRWNSGTSHQKNIWTCVTAVRKGKKACTHSKGLEESIIENAFVTAFNTMCDTENDIINIFLSNMEESFKSKDNKKQLNALTREISSVEIKINKLLDLHLEGKIDKIDYEEKYTELRTILETKRQEKLDLEVVNDTQKDMEKHITNLRKFFDKGTGLKEFDAEVFKSIVERVILGGEDKDGNPEPYMLTFIFKTGFETKIDAPNPKGRKGKKSQVNECSHQGDDTCGSLRTSM